VSPGPEGEEGQPPPESAPEPEAPAAGASELLNRLDPDRASAGARPGAESAPTPPRPAPLPPPVIDTRRYRWMIGIFGLVLVVVVSIYQFASNGVGTTGVPPGQRLHFFAAPLANTNLNGDPNLDPPCTLARHDPRALNICLIAHSKPLVLSFFVIGSSECEHQVDAMQRLSTRFPTVQFAAVAVNASHASTAGVVRSHRWTIPVAYDRDGSVGGLYGVAICPMAELAYRGGIVEDRLIGDQWETSAELAPRVQALLSGRRPSAG
jgi:AhpC/TSA family